MFRIEDDLGSVSSKTFRSPWSVCKDFRAGCKNIEVIKKWNFERLILAYNTEWWQIYTELDVGTFYYQEYNKARLLTYTEGHLVDPCVIKIRSIELLNVKPAKICEGYWMKCLQAFREK